MDPPHGDQSDAAEEDSVLGVDGVGRVSTSLVTYTTIQALQPDLIINAGTAYGFKAKEASIGDVHLASYVAFHDRSIPIPDVATDRCTKISEVNKPLSSSSFVVHNSGLPFPPILSIGAKSRRPHQLHAFSSRASLFGDQDGLLYGAPLLSRQRRTPKPPRAAY